MLTYNAKFTIDGETWTPNQIERLAYERNNHMLHQLKQHGFAIKDGNTELADDAIDYLTAAQAWKVSIENRLHYRGDAISKGYQASFAESDAMWKRLGFSQDKPMKVSHCDMKVTGVSLKQFMGIMQQMAVDERVGLSVHPEHFAEIFSETGDIYGIEPFGMYGTPTLVTVKQVKDDQLHPAILKDKDPSYQSSMVGLCYLSDGQTPVNIPYHQFEELADGFQAKLAVYWPAGVPDELVDGHALHLATEFYYGLKMVAETE